MKKAAIAEHETELKALSTRSQIYLLFAKAIEYPTEATPHQVRGGEIADALEALFAAGAPGLREGLEREALCDAGEDDDALAVEYTRLFDVGASGPPCPLFGGSYGSARMKVMEETIRFYEHFGLETSQGQRELPDHLATELEFLHFLTFSEAEALETGADPEPFRRARRDFLGRHPGQWVPQLCQRLQKHEAQPFYAALIGQLDRFLASELSSLGGVTQQIDPDRTPAPAAQ